MTMSRRNVLASSANLCLSAAFGGVFAARALGAQSPIQTSRLRRGAVLDLPAGFTAEVLSRLGDPMSDGHRTPGAPDGMACFPGQRDTIVLMRNHELDADDWSKGPYTRGARASVLAYDARTVGGVSRIVLDAQTFAVRSSNLVLTGTTKNCAGGISPWGWLSCEETTDAGHGYVFLCDPRATSLQPPRLIKAYGRFKHEAAAVDPRTMTAYLTEDQQDGSFYRFLPQSPDNPFTGRLQALAVANAPGLDTGRSLRRGERVAVSWVDINEPDPQGDTIRREAQDQGAAVFRRGEGLWIDGDQVYMSATTGGRAGKGQIFRLHTNQAAGAGELELVAESSGPNELDMPDNITVSPWGDLFVAEDGDDEQHVHLVSKTGAILPFARNATSGSEIAGICFDPSGQALFLNLQKDGLTVVVRGPFRQWCAAGA